jgi:hypothetical protein
MIWLAEKIPNQDSILMRVHRNNMEKGAPTLNAFKNHGDGMSTDWSQYTTAEATLLRAKNHKENGVIEMGVGDVRGLPRQRVEHRPISENQAHTDVLGEKDIEVRIKFRRLSRWVIPLAH